MYNVWFYIDTTVLVFVPMPVIFVCNITIIYRLKQMTKRHQQMSSSEKAKETREKEQRSTTITLLAVSFVFLLLHAPVAFYQIVSFMRYEPSQRNQNEQANWLMVNIVAQTMMEFQNCVNFYLYVITGRKYRECILNPAGTWRKYNVASTSMQRHDVASTLRRRYIYVMCLPGKMLLIWRRQKKVSKERSVKKQTATTNLSGSRSAPAPDRPVMPSTVSTAGGDPSGFTS